MTREAKCKFCQKQLTLEIDPECPIGKVEAWLSWASCNRCADYMRARGKIERPIARVCGNLSIIKANLGGSVPSEVIGQARENLERLTRRYATVVCDYRLMKDVWQPDFVEQLLEQPHKSHLILRSYRQLVKGLQGKSNDQPYRQPTNDP